MAKTKNINEGLLVAELPKKTFSKFRKPFIELPNLVENQIASFKKLVEEDLAIILKELNPIKDYTEKKFELEIVDFELGEPKYTEEFAKENAESLYDVTGHICCITNTDNIIAVAGLPKKELIGKNISSELDRVIKERETIVNREIFITENVVFNNNIIMPVISEGDIVGLIMLLSKDKEMTDLEVKIIKAATNFLGRVVEG